MSSVGLLDPADEPLWDRFMESHPHGWVCHLSAWKKVLEESFPHIRCRNHLVKWNEDKTRIVAGLPLYDVKSYLLGNRLVSIPYATLCDPLFETQDDLAELLDEAIAIYRRGRYRYIEIRAHQAQISCRQYSNHPSVIYKNHYLFLNGSIDALRCSFHPNVKQSIQRSEKAGFNLKHAVCERDIKAFYALYVQTRKTLGLPPHPYSFFFNIWNILLPKGLVDFPLLYSDKNPVAGMVILKFKDVVSVEYAAWDRIYAKECPNHLLYWEAMKTAYHRGSKVFDFGRTSLENSSLIWFKARWKTQVADLPTYRYPEPETDNVIKKQSLALDILHHVVEKSPKVLCRWIGEYCYRHLG